MAGNTVKLKMKWKSDREASFLVELGKRDLFIPRSLVEYRKKIPDGVVTWIEFTLPAWKVRQEGLEMYQVLD